MIECHEAVCFRVAVLKLRNRAIHSSRCETAELRGRFGQQIEDADDPTRRRKGGRVPVDNAAKNRQCCFARGYRFCTKSDTGLEWKPVKLITDSQRDV